MFGKLEREAQTNMEAMCLLKEWNLVEGETVAIDSFKIRGSNSLKNNFNEKKLKQHLAYIDAQISEYEAQLDAAIRWKRKRLLKNYSARNR